MGCPGIILGLPGMLTVRKLVVRLDAAESNTVTALYRCVYFHSFAHSMNFDTVVET